MLDLMKCHHDFMKASRNLIQHPGDGFYVKRDKESIIFLDSTVVEGVEALV